MIDTIGNAELKNKEEDLLKNMKMLRHTVTDMLGSKSFLKGLIPEPHNGVITVNGEQFPVYISGNTLSIDSHPDITEDIFDTENYLSLLTDDDLMWYALVEHLAHQLELLQEDNDKYNDDLVKANEEIDNLNCKVAEEIKARRAYEESLNQLREELTAADNEIEGLEESLREANKQCTEYVNDIGKLEVDNKRLSERVRTLVCEKCNGKDLPIKFGEQERLGSKQANKIIEDEASKEAVKMDMEMAILHQNNLELNNKVTHLTNSLETALEENNNLKEELNGIKNNNAFLKKEKEEAELLAYRLTRGDMHVQFDSMKSLEHENGVLKNENADLNQKLCQKVMHATYSAHGEEPEDDLRKMIAEYAQKNDDLLERNKRLNQEINKFRVQLNSYSGATVVNNEVTQQTITKEAMSELTAKINELEEKIKDKDGRIDQLSKNNAALSTENKNFGELLREADRTARFYAREVDNLEKEINDLKSEAANSDLEPHEVTANDDMKYTVSLETMNELTARIKELESINENLQEELKKKNEINDTNAESLEFYQKNCREFALKNKDLETEIENLKNENADFENVAAAHLETTAKFADYKERQKRLYKHFKNLAEMIEDLMELG